MKWAFFALFSGFQSVPAPPRTPINRSDDGARDKETEKDYSNCNDPRCSTDKGSISLVMVSDDREGEDFGRNHEGEGIDSGLETAESRVELTKASSQAIWHMDHQAGQGLLELAMLCKFMSKA